MLRTLNGYVLEHPDTTTMSIYQIRQTASGAVLWTGSASDEKTALDAMAREAGYHDYAALPDTVRAGGIETAKLDLIS